MFVNCNWVATQWQQYSTHLHTDTIHRKTQNKQYIGQHKNFGRVRNVHRLCGLNPGIWLKTEENPQKKLYFLLIDGSFLAAVGHPSQ